MIGKRICKKTGVSIIGVVFCVILVNHSMAEIDEKYNTAIWADKKESISKEEQELLMLAQSPIILRKGAKNEITVPRSKTEDELRTYLLAAYWNEKEIDKIKDILNKPWDKEGIEYLWNNTVNVKYPGPYQTIFLFDLLVYVSEKYKETTVIIVGHIHSFTLGCLS